VVRVGVPYRGGSGAMQNAEVNVKTVRLEGVWLIDLVGTRASQSPQFWGAIAAEGR